MKSKDAFISDYNKTIEEKRKVIEEMERTANAAKEKLAVIEELKKKNDELNTSMQETIKRQQELDELERQRNVLVIQTEDGEVEIVGRDDVELVSENVELKERVID